MIASLLFACAGDPDDSDPDKGGHAQDDDDDDSVGDDDDRPEGWVFEPVAMDDYPPDVTDLLYLGDTLIAADKAGRVIRYDPTGAILGSFQLEPLDDAACGLISIALDPDFAANGLFYYGMCTAPTQSGVYRAKLDLDSFTLSDTVEVIIGSDPRADGPQHNIGWIGFDDQKRLIALFGDKQVSGNAQNLTNFLGSVVRVEPSRTPGVGGYTIPVDNPLYGTPDVAAEMLAWGFRSPWSGALDPLGRVWLGDVGSEEEGFEEVDVVLPGQNHGWSRSQGPCKEDCDGLTDPAFSWPHQGGHPYFEEDEEVVASTLRVIWVAPGHVGAVDPYGGRLTHRMLFGDSCLGFVRAAEVAPNGDIVADEFIGHMTAIAAWAEGPDGTLVASTLGSCLSEHEDGSTLYRLLWR